ncbi:MAG: hypothetical protein IJT34_03920 [Butyrivibrio sp.]|nr:hypothetical protein [Butyrivibrio sp.]
MGKEVIRRLAEIYQQLYVAPGADGPEKYAAIVRCGQDAVKHSLSHFQTDDGDSLDYEMTPAGEVAVITLQIRQDFETFLQIMANRCTPVEIPRTQGASTIDGVINWTKIKAHQEEFFAAELDKGNATPDWGAEFQRFTADRNNFKDVLIVLSVGPYSAVPAARMGIIDGEWMTLSRLIRKYHECTHFICRKKYPDCKDAIWDELVADAVGTYAALGRFDRSWEEIFLGIQDGRYTGGRLENYVMNLSGGKRAEKLTELSKCISGILVQFEDIITSHPGVSPFALVEILEEQMGRLWK